jgi:hypothetical protein
MARWTRRRVTYTLLFTSMASVVFLYLDALERGQGRFVNPAFYVRAQLARLDTGWRTLKEIDLTDPRLMPCRKFAAETEISRHQEDMRRILVGKSESFAITQLGPPTCILARTTGERAYRWLSESGLSVDLSIKDGMVDRAELKN